MASPNARLAASLRDRLKHEARKRGTSLNAMPIRVGLERFLHRLGQSGHRDRYLLKGAMPFTSWIDMPFRQTQDLDLASSATFDARRVEADIREICAMTVKPHDGLVFVADSLRTEPIREAHSHQGLRARFMWAHGEARISNQIDIGFGDLVTPNPVELEYPALLGMPQAQIWAYPRETVVAEKFEAIVSIGLANSRMKDFYDLWHLSESFAFDGAQHQEAVSATFARRSTSMPTDLPAGLRDDFAVDSERAVMWRAFSERESSRHPPSTTSFLNSGAFSCPWLRGRRRAKPGTWATGVGAHLGWCRRTTTTGQNPTSWNDDGSRMRNQGVSSLGLS